MLQYKPEFLAMSATDQAEEISRALLRKSSTSRAAEMLALADNLHSEVFWRVFNEYWTICDDTWHLNDLLIEALEFHSAHDSWSMMNEAQRAFFDQLPDCITVYRGCSRKRVRGISWTTDRKVAERFAAGHRGIAVPDAVVARARVKISAIFTVIVERNESELILDPRELHGVRARSIKPVSQF